MIRSIALAILLTAGPIYADTTPDTVGDIPKGITLTKLSETLYSLVGDIGYADCARIVPLLPDHPFTLILESGGGSVDAGLCLARNLHQRDVITVIRDTPELGYQPGHGENDYVMCASACAWLFFAGDVRYLIGDVYLGLHGPSIPENTEGRAMDGFAWGIQSAAQIMMALDELGVDYSITLLTLRIPFSEMLWIKPRHFEMMDELRYLANHYVDFWGFTGTNPHTRLGG